MAAAAVSESGTSLHAPYCFSFMRRGKGTAGTKPEEVNPTAAAPGAPAPGTTGATTSESSSPTSTTGSNPSTQGVNDIIHPYENSIKAITTVHTVEEFWSIYNHLRRPNDLPTTTDYHFFREGIKPTWEDSNNARGGKWIVRLPKGLASRYWEEVILALIGGQFTGVPDAEICGAVVSIRYSEDILGIWNRTATDREIVERLRDAIKRVLQLPPHAPMEYKPHQTSIQDKSSFRNTQVWKPKSLEGRSDARAGEARRSSSWGEREKPKGRDIDRAWR